MGRRWSSTPKSQSTAGCPFSATFSSELGLMPRSRAATFEAEVWRTLSSAPYFAAMAFAKS